MVHSIFLSLLLLLAAALPAADVAATLLKASGAGQVILPGGAEAAFKAGTLIQPGSRIVTREGALAVLMMDDGSRVSVGPNTDLTLAESKAEGGVRSTVFELVRGLFKATVQKLTVGSNFKVKTSDAVAAVKGTEFEVEAGDEGTDARVAEGTVWLENGRGERAVLRERMAARAERNGRLREAREMKREELERFGRWAYESLPGKDADEAARDRAFWERLRPIQQRKLLAAFREGLGEEAWNDITQLRAEERRERWKARLRASDERGLASEESAVDFALRKTTLDRLGRRVRFEEYLLRPASDPVQFLNYSRREGRTDFLSATNTYNQALPRNLGQVRGLNNKSWQQLVAPRFWVVQEYMVMGNSLGDSFASQVKFFDPVPAALGRWELPVQQKLVAINLSDLKNINSGELLERWDRKNGGTTIIGAAGNLQGSSVQGGNVITYSTANGSNLAWDISLGNTPNYRPLSLEELGASPGDFAGGVKVTYGNGRTLQYRSYAIDESGNILNLGRLAEKSPLDALSDYAFRSLQEIQVSSSAFKGDIDVVSKLLRLSTVSKRDDQL